MRAEDNSLLKVCTACIVESNPSDVRSRSGSVNSVSSAGELRTSRPNKSRSATPTYVSIPCEAWEAITLKLDKLDKLDKIDDLTVSLQNIGIRFEAVEYKLNIVENRLTEAEDATSGFRADHEDFVDSSSQQLNEVKNMQEIFQENLNSLPLKSGDMAESGTDPAIKERLLTLEASNASLISRVHCLHNTNGLLAHLSVIVICGLILSKETNSKLAALV